MDFENRRILIVDDQENIHDDFRKVLQQESGALSDLEASERALFETEEEATPSRAGYDLSHASNGKEGLELVEKAAADNSPYSLAFVDVRMPPGWDGIESIEKYWAVDPDMQVVICTAFSDYSHEEIVERLGQSDQFLILKKPFDTIEVRQIADALVEKWRLVQESKFYTEELERRVASRTEELRNANTQLQAETERANLLAEEAQEMSRLKSEFLNLLGHEFRTPLNGVLGMSQLILDTNLDREQREFASTVRNCGEDLLASLNQVLDFTSLEANRVVLLNENFGINDVVEKTLEAYRSLATEKGLEINEDWKGLPEGRVRGDADRLEQALSILVSNAVNFTESGSIRISVSPLEDSSSTEPAFQFEVCDTGKGIETEDQKRLFRPFVQADTSDTRKVDGLGLGLAICGKLVELMKGEIGVESAPGRGSRFWFTARFSKADGKSVGVEESSPSQTDLGNGDSVPASREDGKVSRVLVAEDNKFNAKVLLSLLKRLGVKADVAKNGLEAVAQWQELRHPLIIMDCQMPEMDGFEATRRIRQIEVEQSLPRTCIVACTASLSGTGVEVCFDAGMDDALAKPIKISDVQKVLELVQVVGN